jgi:hypothetical protein
MGLGHVYVSPPVFRHFSAWLTSDSSNIDMGPIYSALSTLMAALSEHCASGFQYWRKIIRFRRNVLRVVVHTEPRRLEVDRKDARRKTGGRGAMRLIGPYFNRPVPAILPEMYMDCQKQFWVV